jgi:hypothetical protein
MIYQITSFKLNNKYFCYIFPSLLCELLLPYHSNAARTPKNFDKGSFSEKPFLIVQCLIFNVLRGRVYAAFHNDLSR